MGGLACAWIGDSKPVASEVPDILLLAGSVRASKLVEAAGRSVLDLPLTPRLTLLEQWGAHLSTVRNTLPGARMRLMLDDRAPLPTGQLPDLLGTLTIERDPVPFRGTGGLLSDVVRASNPNGRIVFVDAAQVLGVDLLKLMQQMMESSADVVLTADQEGRAIGVSAVKCSTLLHVPEIGFVDFKEQVLPSLRARGGRVQVLRLPGTPAMPVRDAQEYLAAARRFERLEHGPDASHTDSRSAFSQFKVVEAGATVDSTARIYDSIVLAGATVERDARVVRSVICSGARVRHGERVMDQVVTGLRRFSLSRA